MNGAMYIGHKDRDTGKTHSTSQTHLDVIEDALGFLMDSRGSR